MCDKTKYHLIIIFRWYSIMKNYILTDDFRRANKGLLMSWC